MLDKKNIIRTKGFILLTGLILLGGYSVFLNYEQLSKKWLEEKATLAYGARIDIKDLDIELFKGTATLKKIQFTNPTNPLKNLFEVDNIALKFNLSELLKKKLVITLIDISGIKAHTQRIYSGELENNTINEESHPALWEKTDSEAYGELRGQVKQGPLKYLSQITTGAYTLTKMPKLKNSLTSLKYLEELNLSLEKDSREWNHQANLLPLPSQLNEWQTHVAQWTSHPREIATTLELKKRKEMATLIREKYEIINQQLTTATKNLSTHKSHIEPINELLNQDIEALKKELSLPTQEEQDLSFSLFGLHIITFLEKFSYWSEIFRHHGTIVFSTPNMQLITTGSNNLTEYHFLNSKTFPSISIEKINLHNDIKTADSDKPFTGEVQDFTLFPQFYGKTCTANFKGQIPGSDMQGLTLNLLLTSESGIPTERFDLVINSYPIKDITIRSTSDFQIKISSATARLKTKGILNGNSLNASGHFETIGTRFSVKSQFQPFEEILDNLTRHRTTLLVSGQVKGEGNKINLSVESEFGKQIAKGISDNFKKQLSQIDDTLKTHILDSLFPLRQNFNEKVQEAENIFLAQMRNTLNDLEILTLSTKKYEPQTEKLKNRHSKTLKDQENI